MAAFIYVSNLNTENITKYDLDGNLITGDGFPITSGISNPNGLFVDSSGFIYLANSTGSIGNIGSITKYDSSGNPQSFSVPIDSSNGIYNPIGVFVDSNGFIYVANFSGGIDTIGSITKYNSLGNPQSFSVPIDSSNGISAPGGLFVDSSGFIYVANGTGSIGDTGSITKYDSSGVQITTGGFPITSGINSANCVFVDSNGFIYVANFNNSVTKYDSSGNPQPFSVPIDSSNGISQPAGLFVDSNGFIYVSNNNGGDGNIGSITKYDSSGVQDTSDGFPITDGIVNPFGLYISCYSKGTKILCKDGYIAIEDLSIGTLVKTLNHGYLEVGNIIHGNFVNDHKNWNRCMYRLPKQGDMIDDLIVTGGHGILVDSLPDNVVEPSEGYYSNDLESKIDNQYLLVAAFSDRFEKITDNKIFDYYHFTLKSHDDQDRRYGVWANGVLSESTFKRNC